MCVYMGGCGVVYCDFCFSAVALDINDKNIFIEGFVVLLYERTSSSDLKLVHFKRNRQTEHVQNKHKTGQCSKLDVN